MLLKVIIYAYLRNLYSSRKIEQALYENIHFIWLSGQSKPDHNTINDFRGKRLQGHLKKIFHQVFANIKYNMNFKRFMLRGIDKVNVEIGLIAMAHNLKKYSLAI